MENFNGKIVAVTGAASGLGRATALVFARRGATLALIDKNEAGLQQLVADRAANIHGANLSNDGGITAD